MLQWRMPALATRVRNIIMRPDSEWVFIEREQKSMRRMLFGYLGPMVLIGPLAGACGMLLRGGGASADRGAAGQLAVQSYLRVPSRHCLEPSSLRASYTS